MTKYVVYDIYIGQSFINALIGYSIPILLLLLHVTFLRHSPWLHSESEYLDGDRSSGSPINHNKTTY